MKLLTKEIEDKLPPLYSQDGKGMNSIVYCKFFSIISDWRWYATEYDPNEKMFFGYVCGHEQEWGYFTLDQLEEAKRSPKFPMPAIERDKWFEPMPLEEALKQDAYK